MTSVILRFTVIMHARLLLVLCACVSYYAVSATFLVSPFKWYIYGGDPVSIRDVPYTARYRPRGRDVYCGAAIISDRFLLSAAHCYYVVPGKKIVTVGADIVTNGVDYDIEKEIPHPHFNIRTVANDIVVIKLVKSLVFGEDVQPIKLAGPGFQMMENDMLETVGFGETQTKNVSRTLLKVYLPYIPPKECSKRLRIMKDVMLCAGGVEGKDTCVGDSGGPLVYKNKLVGIVSYGLSQCGAKGLPGVYARISALRPFIDRVVGFNRTK